MSSADPPDGVDLPAGHADEDSGGPAGIVSNRIGDMRATLAAVTRLSRSGDCDALAREQFGALVKDMESYLCYLERQLRSIASREASAASPSNLRHFRAPAAVGAQSAVGKRRDDYALDAAVSVEWSETAGPRP